jgi:hypothetical protein
LESLNEKYTQIRDRVTLCAEGYSNGLYIWGEGGIGKSFAVITTLTESKKAFILHNTRLSAPAFFKSLEMHRKEVHVVEDVENIFKDRNTLNLLRSALWGQRNKSGTQQRLVTYGIHPGELTVPFDGQIILTGNRPLSNIPELRALATRIPMMHLAVTRHEIVALMKEMCRKPYRTDKGVLSSAICGEVLEFFLSEYPTDGLYDIRILVRAFDDRLGAMQLGEKISSPWKDLIRSQLTGRAEPPVNRGEESSRYGSIALEISHSPLTKSERIAEWTKRTGKSRHTYYRLLRELP